MCLSDGFIQANDDVTKCIIGIKAILYGSADQEPQVDAITQLSQEMYQGNPNALIFLIQHLHRIDFEVCASMTVSPPLYATQISSEMSGSHGGLM